MTLRRIVVVGGSIAAVTAAESLRLEGFDGEIELLSQESLPPYTRVPLSKGALAGRESFHDLVLPTPSDDIALRLGVQAEGLDVERRIVRTNEGEVHWDGLIIASGSRARRMTEDLDELVIRNYGDCMRLQSRLKHAGTVLIVGGGFLGMEVASTLQQMGKSVTVVDREPPLQRLLGDTVSARIRQVARDMGVEMHVEPEGLELLGTAGSPPIGATSASRRSYHADLVVSAVGDVPNVEWLRGSGLPHGGGVHIDSRCQVQPGIVAAGDVAWCVDRPPREARIPSWTNAVDQARIAARRLVRGEEAGVYTPTHYFWTEQFGLDLKFSGLAAPESELSAPNEWDAHSEALITWGPPEAPRRVLGWNHRLRPAQLKRMVTGAE